MFIVTTGSTDFPAPIPPSRTNQVVVEMSRLRENLLVPAFRFFCLERSLVCLQLVYHNVQSLRKHLDDVAADPMLCNSDIVFLAETWGSTLNKFQISSFDVITRTHGPNVNSANRGMGMIAFKNNKIQVVNSTTFQTSCSKGHCEGVVVNLREVRLIGIYKSPSFNLKAFIDILNHVIFEDNRTAPLPPSLVSGDFNEDLITGGNNSPLTAYFASLGLHSRLRQHPTTVAYTQIDNIFGNIEINAGTYPSLFSYHEPIWVQFTDPN